MSAVAGGRSIAYSADTAGRAGSIACQVVRSDSIEDGRVAYSIALRNDTDSDAQVVAFVPDAVDLRHRTIVQSVIGAYSHFATAVELEVERYGGIPELHLQLSGADIGFALIVPNAETAVAAGKPAVSKVAIAGSPSTNGSRLLAHSSEPHETAWTRAPNRTPSTVASDATHPPLVQRNTHESVGKADAQKSPAAFPMLAAFTAIMAVVGIAILRPQIRELVIPARSRAATSIPIAYRITGIGSVAYNVIGPDAELLASGPLPLGAGTFTIMLPRNGTDRAYLVRVGISGIFGSAVDENYVKVSAAPLRAPVAVSSPRPIPLPQIRSLAVDRAMLTGGETLNVYYDVAAAGGSVALFDAASQITYGKANLSPSGHTALVLPVVQSERVLNVIVTAGRGTATTQSRVAVTAEPQSSPTPQADASDLEPGASGITTSVLPVIDVAKTVRSAQTIYVDIRNAVAGLVVVLSDNDGTELARREIEIGSPHSSVTFTAPTVRAAARVRLQAIYPQGAGSETIVKMVDITPR